MPCACEHPEFALVLLDTSEEESYHGVTQHNSTKELLFWGTATILIWLRAPFFALYGLPEVVTIKFKICSHSEPGTSVY